jgi:hypothetical protein
LILIALMNTVQLISSNNLKIIVTTQTTVNEQIARVVHHLFIKLHSNT